MTESLEHFERERGRLFGLAYRMLGSVTEAEDIVQEAWLRWRKVESGEARSPGAYLTSVVTRLCIDHARKASTRREEYVGTWLPEPIAWNTPPPSEEAQLAESLSMAFLLLLDRLSPAERAAYLLREIFGAEYAEIAAALDRNEASCRQLVRRARERLAGERAREPVSPERQQELLGAFLSALESKDYDTLVELLAADAVAHADHGGKAKSIKRSVCSADHVARLFLGLITRFAPQDAEYVPATVNGSLGLVIRESGQPTSALHLEFDGGCIAAIYQIRNPDKLAHLAALAKPASVTRRASG